MIDLRAIKLNIIACDSTNYERWKPETRFNGLIGVSIQTDKPADFKTTYEKAMDLSEKTWTCAKKESLLFK